MNQNIIFHRDHLKIPIKFSQNVLGWKKNAVTRKIVVIRASLNVHLSELFCSGKQIQKLDIKFNIALDLKLCCM
jgi:hypothetical protein